MTTDEMPKLKRVILFCAECKWTVDITGTPYETLAEDQQYRCRACAAQGRSGAIESVGRIVFQEHEKALANDMLAMAGIGKTVDDVQPYEET